jgi:hypothetical protein
MHLATDKASELFGSAAEGFRSGHNGDIERSMQKAALEALGRLSVDAPAGFNDWFEDWRKTEVSAVTQLHLSGAATLPPAVSAFLRERLPEALHAAHEDVLREPELNRSWIGFQQHVYRSTPNQLQAIRDQLNRIEEKLDTTLDGRANTPREFGTFLRQRMIFRTART